LHVGTCWPDLRPFDRCGHRGLRRPAGDHQTQSVVVAGVGPVEIEHLYVRVVSIDRANRSVVVEQT
jgi:hypothetical protein